MLDWLQRIPRQPSPGLGRSGLRDEAWLTPFVQRYSRRHRPLVSCIMPTYNRRDYVVQALTYYGRQDYPNTELIIVDDGEPGIQDLLPTEARIQYIRLDARCSIGEKRNLAIARSHGEIIIHWDDDDWYSAQRISYQVKPLLYDEAELTGLDMVLAYDLEADQFWSIDRGLHAQFFTRDIHAGTLAYRKYLWENVAKFRPVSLAEDYLFLNEVLRAGARVQQLPNQGVFLYIRHGGNSWAFTCGQYEDPRSWHRQERPDFLSAADLAFYRARRRAQIEARSPAPGRR